jgi:arabinosaccharide transport system substrate-binding protein
MKEAMMTTHAGKSNEDVETSRHVSRRTFLRALGASTGAALLAACGVTTTAPSTGGTNANSAAPTAEAGGGGAAAAGVTAIAVGPSGGTAKTTLEFWAFSSDRIKFVQELLKSNTWTSMHPDVAVNFQVYQYEDMHTKLLTALVSGVGAPDIADVEISRFSRFLKGDRVGFIPLNDRIGNEINNLYTAAATAPWSWKDQIYGLGDELNTCVLTYRKDIMDSLGVKTPFETWDDTIAAGEKVVAGGKSKMYAVHDQHFGDWYMLSQSAGTTMFDAQGNYQGANDKSVAVMQFLHDLVYKSKVAGIAPATGADNWAPPTYWAAFKAEQFVATWGPPWHLANFISQVQDQKGKWAVQPFPKGLGDSIPTANFGGTGQCITEQSKNQDIAWDLIKLCNLTTEGVLTDFKIRTIYPTYKPAYDDPALKEASDYFSGQKIGEIYASVASDLPPFQQSPVWPEATEAMNRIVITPVMQDKTDAKTALTDLGTEIQRLKQQAS